MYQILLFIQWKYHSGFRLNVIKEFHHMNCFRPLVNVSGFRLLHPPQSLHAARACLQKSGKCLGSLTVLPRFKCTMLISGPYWLKYRWGKDNTIAGSNIKYSMYPMCFQGDKGGIDVRVPLSLLLYSLRSRLLLFLKFFPSYCSKQTYKS